MIKQIKPMIDSVSNKISSVIGRGVLTSLKEDDIGTHAQVKLRSGQVNDNVEIFQQFGIISKPKLGAEVITISLNGNRDHTIVIATHDRRYFLKELAPGEVALYSDNGDYVHVKKDEIKIKSKIVSIEAETKVTMTTPLLEVTGDIIDNKDSNTKKVKDIRTTYNIHTHLGGGTGTPTPTL